MPHTTTAPRSATEAAHLLAREGKHVHIVSDGHSSCLAGACGPTPVELPSAVREQARLVRLSLAVGILRL
ncbi:MAG: hypothetical protein HOZ81_11005 [Streptomyces sp.]|nr:hypothetical protein [Streptomyces sp.]NUS24220.1 hypothetical protein [Streptomyces sp.]